MNASNKVNIVRSFKRRTISIQIMPDTTITVTVPFYYPASRIEKLLKEKEKWIRQKQLEITVRQTQKAAPTEDEFLYLGKTYKVEIRQNQKNLIELSDKLYIASPNKKYVKQYLVTWYRQQARKIIVERVYHYAGKAGLEFSSVSITSAETRWGSCSSQKSLNFNWKLVMAPLPVLDYVVAHELAHLVELNHSKDFWETVRRIFPLYRQYRTWLKRHGHTLTVD